MRTPEDIRTVMVEHAEDNNLGYITETEPRTTGGECQYDHGKEETTEGRTKDEDGYDSMPELVDLKKDEEDDKEWQFGCNYYDEQDFQIAYRGPFNYNKERDTVKERDLRDAFLLEALESRGLSTDGSRRDLQERLREALAKEERYWLEQDNADWDAMDEAERYTDF